jgi:hypothetical protein
MIDTGQNMIVYQSKHDRISTKTVSRPNQNIPQFHRTRFCIETKALWRPNQTIPAWKPKYDGLVVKT